jgi:hypothetical protein
MFTRSLAIAVFFAVIVSTTTARAQQLTPESCLAQVGAELARQGIDHRSIRIGTQVTILNHGSYTFTENVTPEYLCDSIILPQDARMETLRKQMFVQGALVKSANEERNDAVNRLNAIQNDFVVKNAWGFATAFGIVLALFLLLVLLCLLLFLRIQVKKFRRTHRPGGIHGGRDRKTEPPFGY